MNKFLKKYIDLSSLVLNTEEKVTLAKLISFGILSKNNPTHTSPVIFVARKGTKNKRPVVDFRFLNTRIMRRHTVTLLLKNIPKHILRC